MRAPPTAIADVGYADQRALSFFFLLNQSSSMLERYGGSGGNMADAVAEVINALLADMVVRSSQNDELLPYFRVGVAGYRHPTGSSPYVQCLLPGTTHMRPFADIDRIARSPFRTIQGERVSGATIFPVWIDPTCVGAAPTRTALLWVADIIEEWCDVHDEECPPTVIHISNVLGTDGDLRGAAARIRNATTSLGNVVFFNIHLASSSAVSPDAFFCPARINEVPTGPGKSLFDISSILPENVRLAAVASGVEIQERGRAVTYGQKGNGLWQSCDAATAERRIFGL